jgi:tetratricopeptide (TPR) repeat protein
VSADAVMRVEQALRLLPDVDALVPLRAFLISTSRRPAPDAWDAAEAYRTVGRRFLRLDDLRRRVPEALARAQAHLARLYEAVLDALECERGGDMTGAVRALLRAGACEEGAGRLRQARAWYEHGRGLSEALRDRRPEIESLCALGRVAVAAGDPGSGARAYQRALALAEAERDHEAAIDACGGLGDAAAAQAAWPGAESWYTRGLRLAAAEPRRAADLLHRLARAASGRGDQSAAMDLATRARESLDPAVAALDSAAIRHTQGTIDLRRDRPAQAITAFQEAVALARRGGGDPGLEVSASLGLTRAFMALERWRDAEDEARRGEELAIAHNLTRPLARLYTLLGAVRGAAGDQDGFVFFEKAIELSRGVDPSPGLEGEVYVEYGCFHRRLGDLEEARACFERAQELYATAHDPLGRARAAGELAGTV